MLQGKPRFLLRVFENCRLRALLLVALAVLVVGCGWTETPHGKLDFRAALSLHLLTFEQEIKPDPDVDFEFTMPVNLAYAISAVMPKEDVAKFEDISIPNNGIVISARVYWPATSADATELPPVIVYYHGGGFVVGSVDIFDSLTRSLANATSSIVVSVDYRLAPAHPFPAALDDAYASLAWVTENVASLGGDANKIIVAGDSAGGNLAAVVTLKAKQENGPLIAGQILYYPVVDLTNQSYSSIDNFADGYGLSTEAGNAFRRAYLGKLEDNSTPYVSPLYAESLSALPPALVVTAGFDPLTDGTAAYVERLKQGKVPVTYKPYSEMIHGFMSINAFSQRRLALNDTAVFVEELFSSNL